MLHNNTRQRLQVASVDTRTCDIYQNSRSTWGSAATKGIWEGLRGLTDINGALMRGKRRFRATKRESRTVSYWGVQPSRCVKGDYSTAGALRVSLMGDIRVTSVRLCEGTARTVLVCRTILPFGAARLDIRIYDHIRAPFQLRTALLAFALVRLSKFRMSIRSHPQSWHGQLRDDARCSALQRSLVGGLGPAPPVGRPARRFHKHFFGKHSLSIKKPP